MSKYERDFDTRSLEDAIAHCRKNIKTYEQAISHERTQIAQYHEMIETLKRKEALVEGITIDASQ